MNIGNDHCDWFILVKFLISQHYQMQSAIYTTSLGSSVLPFNMFTTVQYMLLVYVLLTTVTLSTLSLGCGAR